MWRIHNKMDVFGCHLQSTQHHRDGQPTTDKRRGGRALLCLMAEGLLDRQVPSKNGQVQLPFLYSGTQPLDACLLVHTLRLILID